MSLSLDDLGRAAYTAVEDFYSSYPLKKWDELGSDSRSVDRTRQKGEMKASALAAVERFAEEAIRASCRGCANSVRIDESGYHVAGPIEVFVCRSQPLKNLLSSLRDEAGQKGGAT